MLYDRDYRKLEAHEIEKIEEANKFKATFKDELLISHAQQQKYLELLPPAYFYHSSLFPNNYLSRIELNNTAEERKKVDDFLHLLNRGEGEQQVLNYIRDTKSYFIIASILKSQYDFGHHATYLFREFELPPNYKADFLICGKNSGGYEFIFVELESPTGNVTIKGGDEGIVLRKGINQVQDWNTWIEGHFSHLKLQFERYAKVGEHLPREFHTFNKSRVHYAVVGGRREDFNEKTYEKRRRLKNESNILILHYDNLIDYSKLVIETKQY